MTYNYKVLTKDGKFETDSMEAKNRGEVIAALKEKGLTLLDLSEVEGSATKTGSRFPVLEMFNTIRPAQLAFLFRQLGELVESGLPLVSAIDSLQKFCGNSKARSMLEDLSKRIRSGSSMSEAMAAQAGVFNHIQLAMVKVGEKSGNLPEILKRIADLIEARLELRGKVRSALSYPFFVFAFSSILCWVLVTFLLPSFEPIWKGAKVDLNNYPVTKYLLAISDITRNPIDEILLFLFLAGLAGTFWHFTRSGEGRTALGNFLLNIPVLGHYLKLSSTAEASSTMALLLNSGMPMIETLDLAADTAANPIIAEGIREAAIRVREGNDLSTSFDDGDVFPELFVQMVSVGETTGDLPSLLTRVAVYYKRQLDDSLKSLTSLIEPITMVIIGGVVFVFVLGVFLPIMGIVSALSNG